MLPGMAIHANRMSQPGRTGNLKALRIVKAAQRTTSFVDPIGHRSVAATSRNASLLSWSSTLRIVSPVSVEHRSIETGGASLAQRQHPRAFRRTTFGAKAVKSVPARHDRLDRDRKRLIRERCNVDRHKALTGDRSVLRCLVPLSDTDSRGVMRQWLSAAGAQSGLILNAPEDRLGTDTESRANSASS